MTLSYTGKIAVGSTISGAVTNPNTGEILVTQSSTNTLIKYDMTSLSQNGSPVSILSGSKGVCLVDSASALVVSTGTTVDLVHLTSEVKTNYTGGSSGNSNNKCQICAGDTTNKIVLATTISAKTLNRFNGNTFTLDTVSIELSANDQIETVIFKGDGRFLIGTDGGQVCEIDSTGKIYKSIFVDYLPHDILGSTTSNKLPFGEIASMAIDNNLLLVATEDGAVQLWDWSTGTKLKSQTVGGTVAGLAVSEASSGLVLAGRMDTTTSPYYNTAFLMDFTVRPIHVELPIFYADNTGSCVITGIDSTTSKGWAAFSGANDIHVFSISARGSTTRTVTIPNSEDAELLILQDDGAGQAKVVLDTYIKSGGTYRVPTGKTLYEIFKTGSGVQAKWGASKYTT